MSKQNKPTSQKELVLFHLKKHGSLSMVDAVNKYNIFRLAGRIFELRADGYLITSVDVPFVNQFGHEGKYSNYFLKGKKKI